MSFLSKPRPQLLLQKIHEFLIPHVIKQAQKTRPYLVMKVYEQIVNLGLFQDML